ncbi:MAG TPA: class I SAM-dependent methyltransferase [Fulvivirga sp.]|nr:class I SAM-dependent methyltransferase [Fulvivirga sp.]
MKLFAKYIIKKIGYLAVILDVIILPFTIASALWFRFIKFIGLKKFIISEQVFYSIGVFPIVKHYYEPQFDLRKYKQNYRQLPAIDFNDKGQLDEIQSFSYQDELLEIPLEKVPHPKYYYNNGSFPSGDAECYYSLIRMYKPSKIIEIGSGYSTLIAHEAIMKNKQESPMCLTELICVEPYEMPWLKDMDVELIRSKVEDLELTFFERLQKGDILFIDSSHIIRPEGDVLYEILQILPKLNSGVLVHFHDIFTPFNYPDIWLKKEFRLWNEQYLLEAFLSYNKSFEVMLSLSYLTHHYSEKVHSAFPILGQNPTRLPGSFWLKKL